MDKQAELRQWLEIADNDLAYTECSVLTGYAVQTRYPNEISVEKHDMDKALLYAKSVREFIMPFADENAEL